MTVYRSVLRSIIVIFLLLHHDQKFAAGECTDAWTLFKGVYYTLIEEMERGVPRSIASTLFTEFQTKMSFWAIENRPDAEELGDVCFPDSVTSPLFTYDGSLISLRDAVKSLEENGNAPSYVPRGMRASEKLPALDYTVRKGIDSQWDTLKGFLKEPAQPSYPKREGLFPEFFNVMHDPSRSFACFHFWRFGVAGGALMSAEELTTKVVGLAVRLRLLGISEDAAFQILRHHGSFVFNGIRCMQAQYHELRVPVVFWPVYAARAAVLTKDIDTTLVGDISDDVIKNNYQDLIDSIAYYKAWGTSGEFVLGNGAVNFRKWKDVVFEAGRTNAVQVELKSVQSMSSMSSPRSSPQPRGSGKPTHTPMAKYTPSASEEYMMRSPAMCLYGWVWESAAEWTFTMVEKCCSTMCYDTALQSASFDYSIVECCKICNQWSCDGSHDDFDQYTAVVPEFGLMQTQTISIML